MMYSTSSFRVLEKQDMFTCLLVYEKNTHTYFRYLKIRENTYVIIDL